jgi:hypothetical protein
MTDFTTFSFFNEFPDEIKCKIWREVMFEPRVILFKTGRDSTYARVPKPSALDVNHLSRQEALKVYTKVRTERVKVRNNSFFYPYPYMYTYDYVNLNTDIFYMTNMLSRGSYELNRDLMSKLQHLVLGQKEWNEIARNNGPFASYIIACCSGLETITILTSEVTLYSEWMEWDAETVADKLRIRLCNDNIFTKQVSDVWQPDWEDTIAHIRENDFDGMLFENWQPTIEFKLGCFYTE